MTRHQPWHPHEQVLPMEELDAAAQRWVRYGRATPNLAKDFALNFAYKATVAANAAIMAMIHTARMGD